jgi:hypothetical protein
MATCSIACSRSTCTLFCSSSYGSRPGLASGNSRRRTCACRWGTCRWLRRAGTTRAPRHRQGCRRGLRPPTVDASAPGARRPVPDDRTVHYPSPTSSVMCPREPSKRRRPSRVSRFWADRGMPTTCRGHSVLSAVYSCGPTFPASISPACRCGMGRIGPNAGQIAYHQVILATGPAGSRRNRQRGLTRAAAARTSPPHVRSTPARNGTSPMVGSPASG